MEMPIITVLDANFKPIDIIDGYMSLIWTERFYALGDFQLIMPTNHPKAKLYLQYGNGFYTTAEQITYFQIDDSDTLMRVEYMSIDYSRENGSTLTLTGSSIEVLLDDRVPWYDSSITTFNTEEGGTGMYGPTVNDIITRLWNYNFNNDINNPDRNFSRIKWEPKSSGVGLKEPPVMQWSNKSCYEIIRDILKELYCGVKLRIASNYRFYIEIVPPQDKQNSVIFSPDNDTLVSSSFKKSLAPKNIVRVFKQADQEGKANKKATAGEAGHTGIARREVSINADDVYQNTDANGNAVTISDEVMTYILKNYGEQQYWNYRLVNNVEAEINWDYYKYGKDYSLGSVVLIINEWDIRSSAIVTEYIRSWDDKGRSEYPSYEFIDF